MSQAEYQHRARKRFGQNFLHDQGVIDHIGAVINPRADDRMVEIGPGKGALTSRLLDSGCHLDAIELDRDLLALLQTQMGDNENLVLHSGDALKFDYTSLAVNARKLRVVGNLPYNISTPLLFKLLAVAPIIKDMHFMLQLEVVQRLASAPGSKRWGRLGVMAQYYCRVDSWFEVPPGAFSPAPKVQSAVVRLIPHPAVDRPRVDPGLLGKVVQTAFSQRRKTLRNTLRDLVDEASLEQLGIDPSARAETLELEQFIKITESLTQNGDTHG
jgi:16S rRNA (adenine1518-N6/adenine1519-N6)-dimethyltransferase